MPYERVALDGYQWLLDQDVHATAHATVRIAYGRLHEPVGDLGVLDHLASMLRRRLSEPFTAPDGDLVQVGVRVSVRGASLCITVEDSRPEVLRAAWLRVAECFNGGLPRVEPGREYEPVWAEDMALRTGANGLAMNWVRGICPDVEKRAGDLLRELSPAAGRHHCVLSTTERAVVGTGFTTPPACSARPTVLRPADLDPLTDPRHRAGQVVMDRIGPEIMSVVGPLSPETVAAGHMLAAVVSQALRLVDPGVGAAVTMRILGRLMLLTVAIDHDDASALTGLREITELLAAELVPPADDVVLRACDEAGCWAVSSDCATECLLHGVHLSPGPPTPRAARAAYDRLLLTRHVAVERHRAPLPGLEVLRAPLDVPRGRRYTTWFDAASDPMLPGAEARLVVGEHVIAGRSRTPEPAPCEPRAVDADNLAVILDDGRGGLQLIDHLNREITVVLGAYRRPRVLRSRIEAAAVGVPRLRRIHDEELWSRRASAVAVARRRRRDVVWVWAVVVLAVAGLLAYGGARVREAVRPQVIETRVGWHGGLEDGTRVTIRLASESRTGELRFPVEYCAPLHGDSDTYSVTAEDFTVVRSGSGEVEPHTFGELDSDQPTQLAPGECVEGELNLGQVPQVSDRQIIYTDDSGNRIIWTQ